MLEIPGECTVVWPQSQRRAGVKRRSSAGSPAGLHPGLGLCDAPVSEVQFRIVTSRDPSLGANSQHVGNVAPAVSARLAGSRLGVESPEHFSVRAVERSDEASLLVIFGIMSIANAEPLQHLPAGY